MLVYAFSNMLFLITVEGSWDQVHRVIGQAHTLLHNQGIVRIQTDIRVGSRYAPSHHWLLPPQGYDWRGLDHLPLNYLSPAQL